MKKYTIPILIAASTIAVSAIGVEIALFGNRPAPAPLPSPSVTVSPLRPAATRTPSPSPSPATTPVLTPTPAPTVSSTVSKGLEKFSQLVVDNLNLGEDRLTSDDLATASLVITTVWNKRAEWREALLSNPTIAGTDLEVLISNAATQRGYIIRQPISVALQSALKAAVKEWWNNNYERQFVPPDPY